MYKLTEEGCVQDPNGTLSLPKAPDWKKIPYFIHKLSAGICSGCGSTQHQYKRGTELILICQGCGKEE